MLQNDPWIDSIRCGKLICKSIHSPKFPSDHSCDKLTQPKNYRNSKGETRILLSAIQVANLNRLCSGDLDGSSRGTYGVGRNTTPRSVQRGWKMLFTAQRRVITRSFNTPSRPCYSQSAVLRLLILASWETKLFALKNAKFHAGRQFIYNRNPFGFINRLLLVKH